METPSSSTRTNFIFSRKIEESGMKSEQREDRCALIDITNDSPIVGLAMGSLKTPLSKKKRVIVQSASSTPGSGEALLRGQVKSLLQKVEEEAELENRPFSNLLLNLTPANTPQLGGVSCFPFLIPQMMLSEKEKGEGEDLITRSLLLEFYDKSFDSSSSNDGDGDCEDDDASVWSIQANASSTRDEEEDDDDLCEGIVSKIEFLGFDDEIVSVTDSCSP